jgi:hypothetical protein
MICEDGAAVGLRHDTATSPTFTWSVNLYARNYKAHQDPPSQDDHPAGRRKLLEASRHHPLLPHRITRASFRERQNQSHELPPCSSSQQRDPVPKLPEPRSITKRRFTITGAHADKPMPSAGAPASCSIVKDRLKGRRLSVEKVWETTDWVISRMVTKLAGRI